MYILDAKERAALLHKSGHLQRSDLFKIANLDNGYGSELLTNLVNISLESTDVEIPKHTIGLLLSVVPNDQEVINSINKLIDAGVVHGLETSILARPHLPENVLEKMIPYVLNNLGSVFVEALYDTESSEILDKFCDEFVAAMLYSKESIAIFRNEIMVDTLCEAVRELKCVKPETATKFNQLFLIWRGM